MAPGEAVPVRETENGAPHGRVRLRVGGAAVGVAQETGRARGLAQGVT